MWKIRAVSTGSGYNSKATFSKNFQSSTVGTTTTRVDTAWWIHTGTRKQQNRLRQNKIQQTLKCLSIAIKSSFLANWRATTKVVLWTLILWSSKSKGNHHCALSAVCFAILAALCKPNILMSCPHCTNLKSHEISVAIKMCWTIQCFVSWLCFPAKPWWAANPFLVSGICACCSLKTASFTFLQVQLCLKFRGSNCGGSVHWNWKEGKEKKFIIEAGICAVSMGFSLLHSFRSVGRQRTRFTKDSRSSTTVVMVCPSLRYGTPVVMMPCRATTFPMKLIYTVCENLQDSWSLSLSVERFLHRAVSLFLPTIRPSPSIALLQKALLRQIRFYVQECALIFFRKDPPVFDSERCAKGF